MRMYWITLKALDLAHTHASCTYVEPRATFWKNHEGKAKQKGRGSSTQCLMSRCQGSTRRKWDENPSKSNQLSHVQPHVPTVPFVIGSNWIERSSENGGNC